VAIQVVSGPVVTNQVEKAAQDKAALDKVDDTETRAIWVKNAKRFLLLSVSHEDDPTIIIVRFFAKCTCGN
jgi:hypothetical protein